MDIDRLRENWGILGHEGAVQFLRKSLDGGRLPHALLFTGPPGVGKNTLAERLAQVVNCLSSPNPCGQCTQCQRIARGVHADVVRIGVKREEARQRKEIAIEQIRELQHLVSLQPFEGKCRVFIILDAELLSEEAANCLLKTLEEPPEQVLLLLMTSTPHWLPATLRSRCQRVDLHPLPQEKLQSLLARHWRLPEGQARFLARMSGGCPGLAIQAIEHPEVLEARHRKLERIAGLARLGSTDRFDYAASLAERFVEERGEVKAELALWLSWWRDMLLVKEGLHGAVTNLDFQEDLEAQSRSYSSKVLVDTSRALLATLGYLEQNANPRLALESLMLRLPNADRSQKARVVVR